MTSNSDYIKSVPGILKLISIGGVSLAFILGYISYFTSEYTRNRKDYAHLFTTNEVRSLWRELYLMGVTLIVLLCSVVNFALHCWSLEFYWKPKTAIVDFFYHCAAAVLLATSGVLFIVSAVKVYEINCTTDNGCQRFEMKLAAGGISLLTAVMLGAVAVVVLTKRKDVERDRLWSAEK